MVAWVPLARRAMKYGPIALEVARQLDKQLRPHVLAYRKAKEIDGYVARFTDRDGDAHWLVFPAPGQAPITSFPSLSDEQLEEARTTLDVETFVHHSAMPEGKAAGMAQRVTTRLPRLPGRQAGE